MPDLVSITRKRLPKPVRLGILITAAMAIMVMFWIAAIGKSLFVRPDMEPFLGLFFREPLVLVVCVAVAWFISLQKPMPSRSDEYRLLNSLPITSHAICDRFITQDLWSHSWAPGLGIVLYFGLTSVAPMPHLIRLGILTASCYVLIIGMNAALHYRVAISRKGGKNFYPNQRHPIISALTVGSFVICQLSLVIAPKLASGYLFWLVFSGLSLATYTSITHVRSLFAKWQTANLAFARSSQESSGDEWFVSRTAKPFLTFSSLNAWLLKNLLKAKREKSLTSLALTLAFIAIAYLISMNNRNAEDVVTVLLWIMGIYAFIVAFRATNLLGPEEESPKWIYSLPLGVTELYISIFAPLFSWACLVATSFTVLLVSSGVGVSIGGWFWLKSVLAASALLSVACIYAVKSYPSTKKTQRQFLYWILAGVILTAAFYPYRVLVIGLMVLASFLPFRRINLYRVA